MLASIVAGYLDKIRLYTVPNNRLFLPVAAGYALGYQSLVALPFLIGVMQDSFGFNGRQIGMVGGLEIFAMALMLLLTAPIVNRFQRHYVACFGGLSIVALQLLSLLVQDFALFCLLRVLVGASCGMVVAMTNSCIALMPQPERHCGYAVGLATFSHFCLYVALGGLIDAKGAAGAYGVLAATAFPLALLLLTLPAATPPHPMSGQRALRASFLLLLFIPLYYMGQVAVLGYAERIGMGVGLSDFSVGVALGLGELFGVSAPLLAAAIGVRFGHVGLIAFSCAAMMGVGFILLNTMSPLIFFAAYCGFLFLDLFKDPYLLGIAARLDPPGRVLAAASGAGLMGSSLGIVLAGNLVQVRMDFAALSWLLLVPCMLAIYILLPIASALRHEKQSAPSGAPAAGGSSTESMAEPLKAAPATAQAVPTD